MLVEIEKSLNHRVSTSLASNYNNYFRIRAHQTGYAPHE
jgi:hypothetical protein